MNTVSLSSLRPGMACRLHSMELTGDFRRRLQDLGFIPDTRLYCAFVAPSGSPMAILCKNTMIGLRSEDCARIRVKCCE